MKNDKINTIKKTEEDLEKIHYTPEDIKILDEIANELVENLNKNVRNPDKSNGGL